MDAQDIEKAKEELAKLVAAQPAEDVWTTPAMEEKLRIRALGKQLAKTGDREAQRFVAEQARLCKHVNTAGDLALALTVEQDLPEKAAPEALGEVAALFETASPGSTLFRAAVLAVLAGDGGKAVEKLGPLFDVESP